MTLNFLLQNRT